MRRALHELVTVRGAALKRSAFLLRGDNHGADDLLQEALARTLARRATHDLQQLEAYVRRTMVNLEIDRGRRRTRWRSTELQLSGHIVTVDKDRADEVCDRLSLRDALAVLPARQRACVVLHYYEDLPVAEIAEMLDCRPGTVKAHLHDARKTLRRHWSDTPLALSHTAKEEES
ncbi:sigma-70 family RNA polymerase sigma factor [Yinghuangia soli]|uniref:Sigma-70 family RNA polymerase sigma factor n=1 Tax=Yinghuangia soli TaxID=2908204 RepID=A0AA41TY61_9ACTN|nr:sigma-70 family RNA polymerase sigma factor [Yinghuangia soli]MCF2525810.1 sigma-70 family RNA polymerase sigma factor [Yinghuangia soli]